MGDAIAFRVVQDHFDLLSHLIDENQGTIVKTIGDAIMAGFADESNAVRAAVAMLEAFPTFADEHENEDPQLWFYRAAEEAGFQLREGPGMLMSSPAPATLLALCDVLERGTPDMRMHAARYLRLALGEDLGYVTTLTDVATCAEIAGYCRSLLEERS